MDIVSILGGVVALPGAIWAFIGRMFRRKQPTVQVRDAQNSQILNVYTGDNCAVTIVFDAAERRFPPSIYSDSTRKPPPQAKQPPTDIPPASP